MIKKIANDRVQSTHIPYRDSKLTRILQESLGGNSRTTLIINCSPCSYNDAETLSTLRFGIRAKSIKNTARINAELSPAELKARLKQAQAANSTFQNYIAALEAELSVWRSGGSVDQSDWATPDKTSAPIQAKKAPPASTPSSTRSMTPINPVIENLRGEIDSRPQTPTVVGLDKDEREDFLRRENELSDQLAEKESALVASEKVLKETREELTLLKEQERTLSSVSFYVSKCYLYGALYLIIHLRKTNLCQLNSMISACKSSAWITTIKKVLSLLISSRNRTRMPHESSKNFVRPSPTLSPIKRILLLRTKKRRSKRRWP